MRKDYFLPVISAALRRVQAATTGEYADVRKWTKKWKKYLDQNIRSKEYDFTGTVLGRCYATLR